MLRKHWFKLLVFLSLLFLAIRIASSEAPAIPTITSQTRFGFSLFFLLFSFFLLSERWRKILQMMGMKVSTWEALVSAGLPIFSKYVPGKILMILGKAGYLNREKGYPIKRLSLAALIDQLLAVSVGLSFGAFFLIQLDSRIYGIIPGAVIFSAVLLFLFHPVLLEKTAERAGKLVGKNLRFKKPPSVDILKLVPWHVLYWLSLGFGFYLFARSIDSAAGSIILVFAFPFSVCAGIAAVFAPGGLGVRESVLLGAMTVSGAESAQALPIVLAARLWFLAGELAMFAAALSLSKRKKDLS